MWQLLMTKQIVFSVTDTIELRSQSLITSIHYRESIGIEFMTVLPNVTGL